MTQRIKISVVPYLNAEPYIFGLQNHHKEMWAISRDVPSLGLEKLKTGEADIALLPVVSTHQLETWHLLSDYGIAADGPVESVCLFSHVPLHEIKTIQLDPASRTSVLLLRMLSADYWKINPQFITNTENEIAPDAELIIGDRALESYQLFEYAYDLSAEWKKWKGMPFVFAAWISRKSIAERTQKIFQSALRYGLQHMDEVVKKKAKVFTKMNVEEYLTKSIRYELSPIMKLSLQHFLDLTKEAEQPFNANHHLKIELLKN